MAERRKNPIDPTGVPAPTYLSNTTLETYSQGTTPLASSSCMACHGNATTKHVPATASDFASSGKSAVSLARRCTRRPGPRRRS